ncbi:MAG: hypothetical protein CMF46_00580 [Legionellales bacterium]|nr:hypothetical protein [Legionellales bacterium]|tara:strand:+ start:191 stop:601 length:411 start_codon:yes stop_codon:yes gene_type:complete
MNGIYQQLTSMTHWIPKYGQTSPAFVMLRHPSIQIILLHDSSQKDLSNLQQWANDLFVQSGALDHCHWPRLLITFGHQAVVTYEPSLTIGALPRQIWLGQDPLIILPTADLIIRNPQVKSTIWQFIRRLPETIDSI